MEVQEMMEYKVNDQELNASMFIPFVNRIWPGDYDMDKTQTALSKTLNITAYDDVCEFFQMVIILEQLQNCLFFQSIRNKALVVSFSSLLKRTPQLCYILVHSQE